MPTEMFKDKSWFSNKTFNLIFETDKLTPNYIFLKLISLFIKDKEKRIATYSKNHGVKMIGTLDYIRVHVYCEEHERYDLLHCIGNNF